MSFVPQCKFLHKSDHLDQNLQNLGALDIASQEHLHALRIKPYLTQQYTPAQILMFYDPERQIAENLRLWRQAAESGRVDLSPLTPALIWVKIVELQPPPGLTSLPGDRTISAEPAGREVCAEQIPPAAAPVQAVPKPTLPARNRARTAADSGRQTTPQAPLTGPRIPPACPAASQDRLWREVLATLEIQMTKATFHQRLACTRAVSLEGDELTVNGGTPENIQWLEGRLHRLIARTAALIWGGELKLTFLAAGAIAASG